MPSLLAAGLLAALLLGCASREQVLDTPQAGTTGTRLVRTGYVADVRDVTVHDNSSSGSAPVIGALVGGVAGSLIGSGGGRAVAAVGGAAGGSLAAKQLAKPGTSHLRRVTVRFEDGQTQAYDVRSDSAFRVGEPVNIINHNGNIELMP